jgi:hypothetical protein
MHCAAVGTDGDLAQGGDERLDDGVSVGGDRGGGLVLKRWQSTVRTDLADHHEAGRHVSQVAEQQPLPASRDGDRDPRACLLLTGRSARRERLVDSIESGVKAAKRVHDAPPIAPMRKLV